MKNIKKILKAITKEQEASKQDLEMANYIANLEYDMLDDRVSKHLTQFAEASTSLNEGQYVEYGTMEGALHVFPDGEEGHLVQGCPCKPIHIWKQGGKEVLILHITKE